MNSIGPRRERLCFGHGLSYDPKASTAKDVWILYDRFDNDNVEWYVRIQHHPYIFCRAFWRPVTNALELHNISMCRVSHVVNPDGVVYGDVLEDMAPE